MADNFNASLVISTSDAVTNVRNVDAAAKDLDKTLAHLHTTMQTGQNDLTALAGSLKVFKDTQRQANKDKKDHTDLLIKEAKLEREGIVNKGKLGELTRKEAQDQAKLQGIKARNGRNSASGLGNETRRNAESDQRIASNQILTTARVTTELERKAAAEQRTALATAQAAAADDRRAMAALRLANAQTRSTNANLALNDSLSNSRYLLYDVGATYAVLSAALLAIPAATTAVAASYEKDFTNVLRTTGLAGDGAKELYTELKALGREIPLSFGQFSEIASIAGQLGIAKDEIGAFTETVAKFGAASNVATADAATAFGRLENSFNQAGDIPDFYNRVGSAIAKVGVESAASETEIIAVTNQISAAGSQFGFTADQIVGLSGALASVRIRPELARGAFQRILLQLSRAADEGSESFDRFAKYTSATGQAAIDLFKNNPSQFFQEYIAGIKGTISAGNSVSSVLDDIGAKNVFDKQFILGLANGLNVYNKAMSDSSSAFEKGSFLSESTQATFETFAATLTKIGTAMSTLGADLASGTLQPLSNMADTVLNVVNGVDRLVSMNPVIRVLLNGLMAFGAVTGVFLAFKSAQAFVLAGLVGLQQVMGKASIAGALSLKGNISELAKTMLMAKGATAQMAQGLLAGKTSMQQMALATASTTASLQRYTTVSSVAGGATAAATGKMGGFLGTLGKLGSGMLSLVGGPIGALIGALSIVGFGMMSVQEEANQAGEAIARAMKEGENATVNAAAQALSKKKVSFGDGAIAFGNLDKSLREMAELSGVSFDKLVSAATKGKDAVAAITPELDRVAVSKGFKNFEDFYNSADASVGGLVYLRNAVKDIGDATAKSAGDTKAADDAVEKLGVSANQAAPSAEGLAEGLDGVSASAEDVKTKIGEAVDAIFGLVDAGAQTQSALGALGSGLVNSTSMNTTDAGGRDNLKNLQDVLRSAAMEQQALIDSGQQTMQQASANYTTFIDGLMQQLAAKGVNVEQVAALANQAKGVFGATLAAGEQPAVNVKVDDSKLNEAKAYLDSIVAVYGTTNLDVILATSGDKQVAENVFNMGQYVQSVTGEQYVVDVDSDTYKANNKIAETSNFIWTAFGLPIEIAVDANTDPANQAMQALAQYAAGVVNGIIDGINSVRTPINKMLGQNVDPIGHVGWGEMPAASAPQTRAVPNVPKPVSAPKSSGPSLAKTNNENVSSLDGLSNAYDDAAKAAQKAGDAGKKAGEDAANGISDATEAANDYANRLKQGLQSAFDKQYGLQSATDAYYSTLNSINKKRADEIAQIQDLIAKQKELNNSRKEDLVTARKAGIEKAISMKYGEVDRAADYGQQEQSALDSAAAKQKDIDATKKQADEIQAGIGKLTGYSQAAIDNRAALRDLESKMLDMISAYAGTGKSVEQVRAYAQRLTAQFRNDAVQIGFNRTAVANLQGNLSRYIGTVNAVPRTKATKVTADTGQAQSAIGAVNRALGGLPPRKNVDVRVSYRGTVFPIVGKTTKAGDQVYGVTNPDTGKYNGTMLFNRGGQVPGFASGGLIPGQAPANPRADNLFADVDGKGLVKVRSGEFIIQQPAVDYWGLDMFKQLNNMKMPAFNAGGSIGGARAGAASNGPMLVELTAENIAAIQRIPAVNLYADSTKIAEASNHGNMILATQGAN